VKRKKKKGNWRSDLHVPDIGSGVQGVRGPCEGGGRDGEGGIGDGNIVDQAVIEEPIGVFPGNHCADSIPGKLRILPYGKRVFCFVYLGNNQGLRVLCVCVVCVGLCLHVLKFQGEEG